MSVLNNWNCDSVAITNKSSTDSSQVNHQKVNKNHTKYFRPYPEIHNTNPEKVIGKKSTKEKKMFLENGNGFTHPISIGDTRIVLQNTCGPDSIFSILGISAFDNYDYCQYLRESKNETCKFILNLIQLGAVKEIYYDRCKLLMDFVDPSARENKKLISDTNVLKSDSPVVESFREVNAYSNILTMWNYLMTDEPSITRISMCENGHEKIMQVSTLYVNHNKILSDGFRALESAILLSSRTKIPCSESNCKSLLNEEIICLNSHLFIELDVRKIIPKASGVIDMVPITCKIVDIPIHLNLRSEKFR